jgi:hypothetical protein
MINMSEEEYEIELGIKDHIVNMAFDPNANHVLQKVMGCFKE